MFSTQVLPELQSINNSEEEEDVSEIVGFIIVDDKKFEVKKGETKIGRDSSMCSVVIENFTVSKVHAVIESEGIDDTFIYDIGSTNQTKLKKKILKPHCRYKLDDESNLIFGNVTAKFVLPPDKSSDFNIKPYKPNSVNSIEELGDIFDVATQVTASQSTTSSETFAFEKLKGNFPIFKIPNLVLSERTKKSVESLNNYFDEMTQCRLDFEDKTSRTVSHNSSLEKSNIFSLSTQCQIYDTSVTKENKCEAKIIYCDDNHKSSESDKIKFLLNDGQDDVLCSIMSLHSPKKKNDDNSLIEAKIKAEVINISQELNAPTQIQAEVIQEHSTNDETEMREFIENKDLSRDFSNKSSGKPIVTSTPLNKKLKLDHSIYVCENKDDFTNNMNEDFIITQEFNADSLNSSKKYTNASHDLVNLSQNEETQPYLKKTSNDFSTGEKKEKRNISEDLILTQTFDFLGETYQNRETLRIIPKSDDLREKDFTGIENFEKEKQGIKEKSSTNGSSLLPESLKKNAESHLNETLDFTQRNNENDFISTQIFEGTTELRQEDENLKKDDSYNDEDFISTQLVDLPLIKSRNSRSSQEKTVNDKASSKESSPDLLGLEDIRKISEDCIATQKFEIPECQNRKNSLTKITLQTNSCLSSLFETEKYDCNIESDKVPKIIDSSGDETESDLEILFDSVEKRNDRKFLECGLKSFRADNELENSMRREKSVTPENNSNSSYIFELKFENHLEDSGVNVEPSTGLEAEKSDSDTTDCEELAVMGLKFPKKQELPNKTEIEENQMALTLQHDFIKKNSCSNNDCMDDKKSPQFEIERENSPLSPLSLEMPNTQEIETTLSNLRQNESEKKQDFQNPLKIKKKVGIKNLKENITISKPHLSERQIDSLLKRPLDNNTADMVPVKRPKNETLDRLFKNSDKQFSKLVKAHDIAQIQPSRTRNSIKMLTTDNNLNKTDISLGSNIINEHSTSRRKANGKRKSIKKSNGDITSYLTTKKVESRRSSCGGRKKEISPRENNKVELKFDDSNIRILRSSKRNNGISAPSKLTGSPTKIRKTKRNSRTKSEEYFNNPCVNIVFTGFECESLDKIICDLGGKKTNDLSFGEVVVADKVRRTVKFLCAIGLSLPITSPQWLMSCKKKEKFLNPWNFILKDKESEGKWDFELRTSLEKSRKIKLLQGFNVFATKSTKPPKKDLLAIVECCGGTPLSSPPDIWPKNTIIVTCLEDKKCWPLDKYRNIKVVHYEFILSGVLKQKIDFKTYRLR